MVSRYGKRNRSNVTFWGRISGLLSRSFAAGYGSMDTRVSRFAREAWNPLPHFSIAVQRQTQGKPVARVGADRRPPVFSRSRGYRPSRTNSLSSAIWNSAMSSWGGR